MTSVSGAGRWSRRRTKCELTIVAEQFNYTQPPAGQFKGTFPTSPSRTVTLKLSKVAAPFPFSLTGGPFYEGRLFEGGVDKGSVTLAWVSKFFRRATLEIDTLVGSRPARAGARWRRRHGVLRHGLREDRLAAARWFRTSSTSRCQPAWCRPTAGARRICTR